MIPKIIHYCWFGHNPFPPLALKCIESWKKYAPDYQIVEWNEDNFDINRCVYTKEAYDNQKWAFVSDVARLYALCTVGGIYMDTDVELLKPLDPFLYNLAFSGFENQNNVPTGIMASIPNHPLFVKFLHEYDDRYFVLPNGEFDTTTNVTRITETCLSEGLILNNQYQTVSDFSLYPSEYFCPKDHNTLALHITENTVCIHHFDGSWLSSKEKRKKRIIQLLGPKMTSNIIKIKAKLRKLKE